MVVPMALISAVNTHFHGRVGIYSGLGDAYLISGHVPPTLRVWKDLCKLLFEC